MKGCKKLVFLGVVLVTLLFIIDTINAGSKESKKKNIEMQNQKMKKLKSDKFKPEKMMKTNVNKKLNPEDIEKLYAHGKFESRKYKIKKGTKFTTKDSKVIEEGSEPKITKMYKKVKKYKIIEGEPLINVKTNKIKTTKSEPLLKEEQKDESIKSSKKKSQNTFSKNQVLEEVFVEDQPKTCEGQNSKANDNKEDQKRKKYKLVEVVLEDDEEEAELNETGVDDGYDSEGNEEGIGEENLSSQFIQEETEEIVEHAFDDEMCNENERCAFRYEDPSKDQSSCKPLPEDPNREGPKKLTLFVIEEEVDGQVRKRVVPEEDGITMCEVADLLKENYYGGLI